MARGFLLVNEDEGRLWTFGFSGMIAIPGALVRFQPADTFKRQLYFTNEYNRAETELAGLDILWRRRKNDLEWKYLAFMVRVRRRDSAANGDNPQWKLLANCGAADFIRVQVISGGATQWRHYRVDGTVGRWRPNLERLRDVTDALIFAGDSLTANTFVGGTGEHDADTGESDRVTDD